MAAKTTTMEVDLSGLINSPTGSAGGNNNAMDAIVKQQHKMTSELVKIGAAVGLTALIWKGLEPLLTPLLKLLTLLAMVVFLPLMPYIKEMAAKIGDTVKAVREGQTSGDSPGGAFVGGIGALISDNYWLIAGGILAAAFVGSLGTGSIAGALAIAIGMGLIFTNIGEDEIKNAVAAAGIVGLSVGIAAAIATGNPIVGMMAGVITFGLVSQFAFDTVTLESLKTALSSAAVVGIATALAVGIMTGNPIIALVAGSLTFALSLIFDLSRNKPLEFEKDVEGYFGQGTSEIKIPVMPDFDIDMAAIVKDIESTNNEWENLNNTIGTGAEEITIDLSKLGIAIGDEGAEYSLVSNLQTANDEWVSMGTQSVNQTNNIISNLSRIPRKIVTTHVIRTVRE